MRIKRFLATTLGTALVAGMVFTGCGSKNETGATTVAVTSETAENTDEALAENATDTSAESEKAETENNEKVETTKKSDETKKAEKTTKKETNSVVKNKKNTENNDNNDAVDGENPESLVDDYSDDNLTEEDEFADDEDSDDEDTFSKVYEEFYVEYEGDEFDDEEYVNEDEELYNELINVGTYVGQYVDNDYNATLVVSDASGDKPKLHFCIQASQDSSSTLRWEFDALLKGGNTLAFDNCVITSVTSAQNPDGAGETVLDTDVMGLITYNIDEDMFDWEYCDYGYETFVFERIDG